MQLRIHGGKALSGSLALPADKSITHRALMFAAMAEGESHVRAPGAGEDNLSTARFVRALGVEVEQTGADFRVVSPGLRRWQAPIEPIDCGNSGTTMRLGVGMLAGAGIAAELVGDASLSRRPMGRVCGPLRELGAHVAGRLVEERELPPLRVVPASLRGAAVRLAVASAQAKSAVLLAALGAGVALEVTEPHPSRDHTERLLRSLGCELAVHGNQASTVVLGAEQSVQPLRLDVPGDFSSAAFWIAAGILVPGSRLTLEHIGVNPTRTGLLEVVEELGGVVHVRDWHEQGGEPVANLAVEASGLAAERPGGGPLRVDGDLVPRMIDELPIAAALLASASGPSEIRDARELRVKESDRIAETRRVLAAFGVDAEELEDGLRLRGPQALRPATLDVSSDHRIALTALVLALATDGETRLDGFEIASISFPGVVDAARRLGAEIEVLE